MSQVACVWTETGRRAARRSSSSLMVVTCMVLVKTPSGTAKCRFSGFFSHDIKEIGDETGFLQSVRTGGMKL
jgi:hypothetical protein